MGRFVKLNENDHKTAPAKKRGQTAAGSGGGGRFVQIGDTSKIGAMSTMKFGGPEAAEPPPPSPAKASGRKKAQRQPIQQNIRGVQPARNDLPPDNRPDRKSGSFSGKRRPQEEYSLLKGIGGVFQKGMQQVVQAGGDTLALAEDLVLAPFEKLSGMEMGALSDSGPFNTWAKNIREDSAYLQDLHAGNVAAGGKAAELFDLLGSAAVATIPQAFAAMYTGGASMATSGGLQAAATVATSPGLVNTVKQAISKMASDPQYWLAFSQTVGSSYENAMADMESKGGYENDSMRAKAALQALGNGLMGAAVEVGGGIQRLPEELRHGEGVWKSIVDTALDEGKEEVIQGIIDRATQNLFYDKGNPLASATDPDAIISLPAAAEEFMGGAVVGGLLGGGQAGILSAGEALANRNHLSNTEPPSYTDLPAETAPSPAPGGGATAEAMLQAGASAEEARRLSPILETALSGGEISGNQAGAIAKSPAAISVLEGATGAHIDTNGPLSEVKRSILALARGVSAEDGDAKYQEPDAIMRAIEGGKRVDYTALNDEQFEAWNHHDDLWVDAKDQVYQMDPGQHISQRTYEQAGSRQVRAFQFDHPELRPFYQQAASSLLQDAAMSLNHPKSRHLERTMQGKRYVQDIWESPALRSAMDQGLSRNEIIKAAEDLVADHGQENHAAAKRLEMVLDDMLTFGYTTADGKSFGPNEDYIRLSGGIPGYQAQEREELPIWDMEAPPAGIAVPESRGRSGAELIRDIQQVRQAATALGENGSKALSAVYDAATARYYTPQDVTESFFQIYQSVVSGKPLSEEARKNADSMPEHLRVAAEDSARRDAARENQAQFFGEDAGLVRDRSWKKAHLSSKDSLRLDGLGKALGVQIRFTEQIETPDGGEANAKYENGVIVIALNARDPVVTAAVHEAVHRLREIDGNAYGALADFVLDHMSDIGMDLGLASRGELYGTTDTDYLTEELVADAFGRMLDQKLLDQFATDNRSAAQKLLDILRDIGNAIMRVLKHQNLGLTQAQISAFQDLAGDLHGLEQAMGDALEAAAKRAESRETSKKSTKADQSSEPAGGRYSYVGEKAIGADLDALAQAAKMELDGKDSEAIRQETGWFRGADGKWRFEIDDSGMEFRRDGDARLMQEEGYRRLQELTDKWSKSFEGGQELSQEESAEMERLQEEYSDRVWEEKYLLRDFLRHDELFRAYPQLNLVSVAFDDLPGGVKGAFRKTDNTIVLNNDLDGKALDDTLIHEIQHAIQKMEDFSGGSSPAYWAALDAETGEVKSRLRQERVKAFRELSREEQNQYTRYQELMREQEKLEDAEDGTPEAERYIRYEQESDQLYLALRGKPWFQRLVDLDRKLQENSGEEYLRLYRKTAGEIEARDTANRRTMTAEQRRAKAPDIGDEDVVFAGGGYGMDIGRTTAKAVQTDGKARFSIQKAGGKNVVWIENSSLSNKDLNDHRAVAAFIAQHIGEVYTIIESGQKVYIGKDLPGEYTQSKYTSYLRKTDRAAARAKNKAVDGLGELIETATNRRWEQTHHTQSKDAKYGMYRYDSTFAFPVKDAGGTVQRVRAYDTELLIRNASDGKKYLYDIVNIKENTSAQIDLTKREARSAAHQTATGGSVSTDSVSQTGKNVNAENQGADTRHSKSDRELLDTYVERYGAIPQGEKPVREVRIPRRTAEDRKVSQTVRTILEASATPDALVPDIEELTAKGAFSYEAYTDRQAISDAAEKIGGANGVGWDQAQREWFDAMKQGEVSKELTVMGWTLYNHAANSGDTKLALDVLEQMVGHQRNAAQALQATRVLKQLPPETQLYGVQRSVARLQEELNQRFGENDGPELEIDQTLAERFLQAKDQEARDAALRDIYRDIGRQMPSRFRDKWNAWRYLAMLGNPRTHVRNVIGNAGFAPVVAMKDLTATAIEEAVYRVSGGRLERSKGFVGLGKHDRSLLRAAWGDYAKVQDAALGGGKYSDFSNANRYIEEGRVVFKNKALEAARKGNSRALDAEDSWFSMPHYAYALAQYCKAHHITPDQIRTGKGLKQARAYAVLEAQKATYRDTNALSQTISEFGRVVRPGKNPVRKGVSLVMEGILPFRKTPANILARGLEYSPLGLMNGIKEALVDVRAGKKTGAEAIDHLSAGLTGTGLLALGIWLAAQGLVRGHGPGDDKEKKFQEMMGHQAYSLELPGGTSVTLDWLAPECLPFFVGVNLWEQTGMERERITLSELLNAVTTVSEPMLEMSCLQSLNDVFDAVGYASSEGLDGLPAALASAATSYLTQALPTILGQAERTAEDKRYTTYTEKNAFLTGDMQYTLGRASARIPVFDYQQIPYIDAWGRVEQSGNPGARAFNNFLNPAYTSQIRTSEMEEELLRLYRETGEGGVLPDRAAKFFTVDGERKDLTAEEYVQYATLKGQTSYELISDLIQSGAYRRMSEAERVQAVKNAYQMANQTAKEAVSDYAPDAWIEKAAEAEETYGIGREIYITLNTKASGIQSLKDEEGETIRNSKGLQIMELVYNTPGLTDPQRTAMFEYLGVGKTIRHFNKTLVQQKLEQMRSRK